MIIGSGPAGQDCLELPEFSRGRNGQLSTGRQGEDQASIPAFLGMGQWNCSYFLPYSRVWAHLGMGHKGAREHGQLYVVEAKTQQEHQQQEEGQLPQKQ